MVSIKLNMRPLPSPRPTVTRYGTHMSKKYVEHKKLVQAKIRGFKPYGIVPLRVKMIFSFIPSKSAKKNKYPMVKGDIDNTCKTYLDAMEGILYENDTLIVELTAIKKYGDSDSVTIEIEEL